MEITGVTAVYFSATYSTKKVVNYVAGKLGAVRRELDVTCAVPEGGARLSAGDLLVVGVPAYGGRVPAGALAGLDALKGDGTPAVLICVYGNRDYDDTLLELSDIACGNGFVPVAAAAVVAEHCIFPAVASGRPDGRDWEQIDAFCRSVRGRLAEAGNAWDALALKCGQGVRGGEDARAGERVREALRIKGNRPYKMFKGVPIHPSAGKECNACGACAAVCPAKAINAEDPRKTREDRCMACARCVSVCPQHARKFRGLVYKLAARQFAKANAARREPEFMLLP